MAAPLLDPPTGRLLDWAVAGGYGVFTRDFDFGTMLALAHKFGPSVVQVRAQNVLPDHLGGLVAQRFGNMTRTWHPEYFVRLFYNSIVSEIISLAEA